MKGPLQYIFANALAHDICQKLFEGLHVFDIRTGFSMKASALRFSGRCESVGMLVGVPLLDRSGHNYKGGQSHFGHLASLKSLV